MTVEARPIRARRWAPAAHAVAVLAAVAVAVAPLPVPRPAYAQSIPRGIPLIRDAEIEQLLRDYTIPILRVAGLAQQNVQVVIIQDRSFNAFVMDGRHIFVNAGALMDARTPNEIIGVLAHETGHMAGGHLSKLRQQLATAQTQSIIAMILGIGAAVAARNAGNPAAAVLGPQETIRRSLLSYQRQQEEQADLAGVKFLNASGQSPKGMYDTFKRMSDEVLFAARNADPYLQSHPLPAERVQALAGAARGSPYWDKKDPPELQLRHDLMRAKLYGFLDRGDAVARRYPMTDQSLAAKYARAISTYRHSDLRNAIAQIDALIAAQPNNPYFHELKGQALLEGGKADEAIGPLRRAIQLAPKPALIQVLLAQALNAQTSSKSSDEAVNLLRTALAQEPESADGFAQLAVAYSRKGDLAQADLASATSAFMKGDAATARQIAARAKTRFPIGSPGWVKADDIVATSRPNQGAGRP
ncbi:M48 family metalloprotease [Rhodoplanes sp. Z2-YC6860]|uniref:M48 family metalloprotease n=1 Tax=Rhodoplanes sp. Z2-YC6860 TaxID=674703 RepID=UPI00078C2E97|nr:M48 family metalloprotease [Rhodoplanes sp. Z2-YC6860]AMN42806.1 peptidase M48, Ste24p [Rhodoplanes sp. Z2-YC6860]